MIHIACCGHINLSDSDEPVRRVIEERALKGGFDETVISECDTPFDLVDALANSKLEAPVDIVICGTGLSGMSGIELVRDVRDITGTAGIVLCSETDDNAYEAISLKLDGYLVEPITCDTFSAALDESLRRVAAYHDNSILVKTRDGARRIRFSQFVYAKTVDHDQEIHLTDGTSCRVRLSSQAFFDMIKEDSRFFKAGSSYIVNVRMVRFVDSKSSTARMMDGTVVSVPVRVRKSLEMAILANG